MLFRSVLKICFRKKTKSHDPYDNLRHVALVYQTLSIYKNSCLIYESKRRRELYQKYILDGEAIIVQVTDDGSN